MVDEPQEWLEVKTNLMRRFKTVSAAAAHYGCSTFSLRYFRRCPGVASKLQADGMLPQSAASLFRQPASQAV